jgi:hypothetical protein
VDPGVLVEQAVDGRKKRGAVVLGGRTDDEFSHV